PAPTSSVETILHSDVVIGYNAGHLDTICLCQLGCHLEVQYVTRVVFNDVQHTSAAVNGTSCRKHLVGNRRGKDRSRACGIKHAPANKAAVHRFMATATTRDDTYFATYWSISTHDDLVLVIHAQKFRV